MNYEANTTHWRLGDLVIHDADAKRVDMIMIVIGYTRDGLCKTRYIEDARSRKVWVNELKYLHAIDKFGLGKGGRAHER